MRWCKTRQFLSSGISGLQKLVHLQPLGIQLRLEHPKGSFHTTAYWSSCAPKKSTKNLSICKGAVMLDPLLACDPRLPGILINVSCFPTLTSHTPVLTLTISQTAASIFHHGIPGLGRKYISQCLTIPLLLFPHSPHTQCLKILYTQVSTVPDH